MGRPREKADPAPANASERYTVSPGSTGGGLYVSQTVNCCYREFARRASPFCSASGVAKFRWATLNLPSTAYCSDGRQFATASSHARPSRR